MKKLVLPLNIIFLGLSLACDTALIITHLYPIKITASVFFMLAATVNLIYALKYFPDKKLPSVILTVGVFFAMSADIAINLNFIAGAAIFALGHICYFIAYSLMQKPRPTDFIPAIIIFIPIVLFMMFSPLLDFGSSHLARRTFVGNLYKQVKDPNLVGALSGHKEGSKAFARYRTIDDEMKQQLVDLLK